MPAAEERAAGEEGTRARARGRQIDAPFDAEADRAALPIHEQHRADERRRRDRNAPEHTTPDVKPRRSSGRCRRLFGRRRRRIDRGLRRRHRRAALDRSNRSLRRRRAFGWAVAQARHRIDREADREPEGSDARGDRFAERGLVGARLRAVAAQEHEARGARRLCAGAPEQGDERDDDAEQAHLGARSSWRSRTT